MPNPIKSTIVNCVLLLLVTLLFLAPLIWMVTELSQDYATWKLILNYLVMTIIFGWLPIRVVERSVKELKRLIRQHEEERNNQKESIVKGESK